MERQHDIDEEIEIDIQDLLLEVLSYWKIVLLVMILAGSAAFAISKFMITPMYESTSQLYVLSKSTKLIDP